MDIVYVLLLFGLYVATYGFLALCEVVRDRR